MKSCHACKEAWDGAPGSQPGQAEICVKCGADLHCCLNCSLFDHSSYICTSRTTEPVKDKEKRNFCDEFTFTQLSINQLGTPKDSVSPGGLDTGVGSKAGGPVKSNDDMNQKWKDIFG
jgi:hypothetical protein